MFFRIHALDAQTQQKERRHAFAQLTRKGDFAHNVRVINLKEGDLILARTGEQPSPEEYSKYKPCPDCYGFFKGDLLYRHIKKCPVGSTSTDALYRSRSLMLGSQNRLQVRS